MFWQSLWIKQRRSAFRNVVLFVRFFNHFYFVICVFLAMLGFCCCSWASSIVSATRGYSLVAGPGLLISVKSIGSQVLGLYYLWSAGSAAVRHMGSSQTRNQTDVPGTGRGTLDHWKVSPYECHS